MFHVVLLAAKKSAVGIARENVLQCISREIQAIDPSFLSVVPRAAAAQLRLDRLFDLLPNSFDLMSVKARTAA